ncbi:MAG: hypothetical protein ACREQ7_04810 [Candidatus Binatia bacterium]
MKAKKFDCVEMMHRGAEKVQNTIRRMTKKEEIAFWKERSRKLSQRQNKAQGDEKHEIAVPE